MTRLGKALRDRRELAKTLGRMISGMSHRGKEDEAPLWEDRRCPHAQLCVLCTVLDVLAHHAPQKRRRRVP